MFRIEKDILGEKEVPKERYYGIHTARSIENFKISGMKNDEDLIKSIIYLKISCAKANYELNLLSKEKADAIIKSCEEILENFENFRDEFPIDIFHAGSGTSLNMNVNEVIANKAIEILYGKENIGKKLIHPNDDVNKGQSTNDIIPSAIKISSFLLLKNLKCALKNFENELRKKEKEFKKILKSGRTHLQDAVPITLGQEFGCYAEEIKKDIKRINLVESFLLSIPIGGNAVGTGINTKKNFGDKVVKNLNEILKEKLTDKKFKVAKGITERISLIQFLTDIAHLSSILKLIAIDLNKISNDLRLMNSGPNTGFNEIFIPAVEPGSSIMPGKINPSINEAINQVCYKIIGDDVTITNCCAAGQLELNTHMPIIANLILNNIKILTNAINIFAEKVIKGIKANEEKCRFYAENSLGLITVLNPILGYDKCAEIAKKSRETKKSIIEILIEDKYLTKKEIKKILNVKFLTEPNLK
ncbi:MAG: aspartate ammonia-lyase [Candidatus Altarchaeaceae archaeon]